MLDVNLALAFLHAHKWMLLVALVLGAIARLTKDDARILPDLPGRWRPLLVLGLGALVTACDAVVAGQALPDALVLGLGSAVTAILGHTVLIHSLRGGRELPLGPLEKRLPTAKTPKRPPPPPRIFVGVLALVVACHAPPAVVQAGVEAGCQLIEAVTSSGAIKTLCASANDIATIVSWIASKQADAGAPTSPGFVAKCRQLSANGVTVCATDDELGAAIDVVAAQHAARFKRDAGVSP